MSHADPASRALPASRAGRDDRRAGSSLLLALLILAALTILATTAIVTSVGDRNLSRYDRHSLNALGAAETGIAFAKRAIVNVAAPMGDFDSDGRPDFALQDSLDWGGTYRVIAESSDITAPGISAYRGNGFTIISEGRFMGAVRRIKVEIAHDTYLKFGRFVATQAIQFECGDVSAGEVYAGNNISITCGCPPGQEPIFMEKVYAEGSIPQASCGVFEKGYEEGSQPIDILNSFDWGEMRDRARGLASNNSCGGQGSIGIYINLPGIDPLGLATQPGDDENTLVFDNFDFWNTTLAAPDTVITYRNIPVINTVTGVAMRRDEFNGMVFFEGVARARGRLDGVSAFCMSVWGTAEGIVTGDILTGHTGFDPWTRLPNGSGDPVTSALIAENYVAMGVETKRILRVDSALFSRTSDWRVLGGIALHAPGGPGPLDLDMDNIWGETPHNHDPANGQGWDELNITDQHWVLNTTGPILTYHQGDAFPWTAGPHLGPNPGQPRKQIYSLEYEQFPPACFPVPLNLWVDVSWTEIFDSQGTLAEYLPN